jgi:predicted nucleic acid-binding protein
VIETEMTDISAIADYAELRRNLGDGEAATIAAAAHLQWIVGMDERGRAKREAIERVGQTRLLNTPGVLVHAVRTDLLTIAEAESIRLALGSQRFVIKQTIAELL